MDNLNTVAALSQLHMGVQIANVWHFKLTFPYT